MATNMETNLASGKTSFGLEGLLTRVTATSDLAYVAVR